MFSWLLSYPECHKAHFSRSRCPGQWEGRRGRAVCRPSPPNQTATDRNCWGTDQRDDLWSNPTVGESRDAAKTSESDSVELTSWVTNTDVRLVTFQTCETCCKSTHWVLFQEQQANHHDVNVGPNSAIFEKAGNLWRKRRQSTWQE